MINDIGDYGNFESMNSGSTSIPGGFDQDGEQFFDTNHPDLQEWNYQQSPPKPRPRICKDRAPIFPTRPSNRGEEQFSAAGSNSKVSGSRGPASRPTAHGPRPIRMIFCISWIF